MKFPSLLSEILRSNWLINPRLAVSYGPAIIQLLQGKSDDFETDTFARPSLSSVLAQGANSPDGLTFESAPQGSIAVINLEGVMRKYSGLCNYGTEEIGTAMRQAANSPNIDAIILKIDSGGGSADSIAPMLDAIAYCQKAATPVIALADICASAAYWTAAACDQIIAENNISAQFGSIGVMMSFADMSAYYAQQGVVIHTVYAPESDHKNISFENALKGDYAMVQEELLSPMAIQFQNSIKAFRGDKLNTSVEGILNGKMFYASQAVEYGLADKVGNLDFAVQQASKLATYYKFLKS